MTCFQAKDCGVSNPLNIYLREIKDDPLLSAAEERALAEAIAAGRPRRPGPDDPGQPPAGRQDRPRLRRPRAWSWTT